MLAKGNSLDVESESHPDAASTGLEHREWCGSEPVPIESSHFEENGRANHSESKGGETALRKVRKLN